MSKTAAKIDLEKALLDPAGTFTQPSDIVHHPDLLRSAKIRLLTEWERGARDLAVAEDEGMTGGEESMLNRVRQAIAALGADAETEHPAASTKHG
ncbi:MAG TPA: hypothetical protein VHT04_13720 [Stellaceae bacterium]|jgi:hypothetical protein|nr:hypothetical protein [Stellaceae bacterium]